MALQNTHDNWGWLAVSFHWLSAVVVFGLFALGLWMVELSYYDDWYKTGPTIHKSIGILLFIATLLRIAWRRINPTPATPASHTAFEKRAAGITHVMLYILLFTVMLSGYMISTADGRSVEVFELFSIPALIHGIDKQEDIAGTVHLALAITLVCIALLHAGAAIKHHFIDKDRTLKRMLGL